MRKRSGRMTTVSGAGRHQKQQESTDAVSASRHPLLHLRKRTEEAPPVLPHLYTEEQAQGMVAGAVEGVHAFYRCMLGDEAFRAAYARYEAEGRDWSPQDEQLLLAAVDEAPVEAAGDAVRFHHPHDRNDDDQPGGPVVESQVPQGAVDDEGESPETSAVDNQPSSSQASDGTPEGGQGKEGSPPPVDLKCHFPGCEFEAGSERGLKAHKTAKKHD